jgi:hypothetical protein
VTTVTTVTIVFSALRMAVRNGRRKDHEDVIEPAIVGTSNDIFDDVADLNAAQNGTTLRGEEIWRQGGRDVVPIARASE